MVSRTSLQRRTNTRQERNVLYAFTLGIYTTGILLFAASLFAQQPSGTVSTGTSTRKTQITPKDLAVGNRFFYNINGKRLVEEVVAKRTIGERVYAVLRSTPGSMERLERSDERGVYEYHSGSEQCIVSFEAAVNDSLPWTDGTDYTNRSAMLYLREINKQEVFGAQVQAFSGNYRFRQGGMTGGGMYAERFGFVGAMLFGSSSRTNRSVQLRGAVLRGQTFGDVSTTSPPRLKKAPTALFSRTMQTGITPNMNIQLYVPDTTLISLWIFTKQNRLVRKVLDNTIMPEGDNTVSWNGTNEDGRFVSPGDYWCVLLMNGRETDRIELTNNDNNEVIVYQTSNQAAQRAMLQGADAALNIPIEFYLGKTSVVNVGIYGLDGKLIQTVLNERRILGEQSTVWNGRDAANKAVAKGPYLCIITTERGKVARTVIVKP